MITVVHNITLIMTMVVICLYLFQDWCSKDWCFEGNRWVW